MSKKIIIFFRTLTTIILAMICFHWCYLRKRVGAEGDLIYTYISNMILLIYFLLTYIPFRIIIDKAEEKEK